MKKHKAYWLPLIMAFSLLASWAAIEYSSLGLTYLYHQLEDGDLTEGEGVRLIHPLFSGPQNDKVTSIWHPYRTYANPPNVENRVESLSTDRWGFTYNRTPKDYSIPKPPGVKRIILLGGSAAEGHGASSNSTTIAAELEELLEANHMMQFEVINAGVGGYASISELIYLIVDLMRFEPDYVITFDGFNDMWLAMELLQEKRLIEPNYSMYQFSTVEDLNKQNTIWFHVSQSIVLLKKRVFPYSTAVLKYIFRRIGPAMWEEPISDFDDLPVCTREASRKTAEQYLLNLRLLASISAENNIKLLLTIQPEYLLHPSLDNHPSRREDYEACFLDYYTIIQDGVSKLNDKRADSLRTLSLVSVFEGLEDKVFVDSVHLNDLGQSMVAYEMYSIISAFEGKTKAVTRVDRSSRLQTIAAMEPIVFEPHGSRQGSFSAEIP